MFEVCDPVLGDNGALYVPESLIPIYQNEILPLSDIVTPNQYEAEWLTGIKIASVEDAWKATEWFHSKGVKTVVLSSTDFASNTELIAYLSHQNGKQIQCFESSQKFNLCTNINSPLNMQINGFPNNR